MNVYILSAFPKSHKYERDHRSLRAFHSSAAMSTRQHFLVNNPKNADIVLFADRGPLPLGFSLLLNPIWWLYNHKCFVYDDHYNPCLWHRGLITSLDVAKFNSLLHRGAAYIHDGLETWTKQLCFTGNEKYLFSFCGALETHPVRQMLKSKISEFGLIFDVPRSITQTAYMRGDEQTIERLHSQLESICKSSYFVLCPRGVGSSSMRLFEAMSMGRAPVIISDEWVPPFGADWDSFSIRVAESEIEQIPSILHELRHNAQWMGNEARNAWESWYAPIRHFDTSVLACIDILGNGKKHSFSLLILLQTLFSPQGLRQLILFFKDKLCSALR